MELFQERAGESGEPVVLWAAGPVVAIVIATVVDFFCAWIPVIWITPLIYVLYTAGVSAVLIGSAYKKQRELRRVLPLAAFIVAMAILYHIPWNTRKPFLMDLSRVRIGMTCEEVEIVMSRYIKGSGIQPVGGLPLTRMGS